jgi:hypothetical protein
VIAGELRSPLPPPRLPTALHTLGIAMMTDTHGQVGFVERAPSTICCGALSGGCTAASVRWLVSESSIPVSDVGAAPRSASLAGPGCQAVASSLPPQDGHASGVPPEGDRCLTSAGAPRALVVAAS